MESTAHAASAPCGVLLVNLGSPSAPTEGAVRAFLDEFLADPAVVDLEPALWWLVRKAIVLPRRSARVAELYRSIWTPEGSPLAVWTQRQGEALARELGSGWRVAVAMRYGEPSIARGLAELEGARSIVAVPLFPQFSHATTGSIERELASSRREVGIAPPFFEHPGYLAALAARVREALASGPVDHFVMSFHGLPIRFVERGDPYPEHCRATARALARTLALEGEQWSLAWQSRFGRGKWLEPLVDQLVPALAPRHPRVLVIAPGFVADCLETLEELGVRLRARFLEAGGRELRLAPCMNDHPLWIGALADIVRSATPPRSSPGVLA